MNKYVRYVVVGTHKLSEHSYSTDLGGGKALEFAIDCAKHPSMEGDVFGEDRNGNRERVFKFQESISK